MTAVKPKLELCEDCPLTGCRMPAMVMYPEGYAFLQETPAGLAVQWDDGDELHLTRRQVVELHELLAEHAERWR